MSISFNELSVVVFFSLYGNSYLFVVARIRLALDCPALLAAYNNEKGRFKIYRRTLTCVLWKKSNDDDMSNQKSLILYVFCFSPWKNCLCTNKILNILSIFPRLNQRINLVCKYDLAASESENKPGLQVKYWVLWWKWTKEICERVLKFVGWLGSELSLHELKMVSDLPTVRKRAKRKSKISKVCNLTIALVWEPYGSC